MSRSMSASMIAQFSAPSLNPITMVDLDFSSGWVRAWTGYGDLTWSSNTYTGVGTLMAVSSIPEQQGAITTEATIYFTPQASLLALALGEAHRGRKGIIRIGTMNGTDLIEDPLTVMRGIMEPMLLRDEGEQGRIELKIVNRLNRFSETRERRLTDQEQRRRYSLDAGLEFVTSIPEKRITWSSTR